MTPFNYLSLILGIALGFIFFALVGVTSNDVAEAREWGRKMGYYDGYGACLDKHREK